MNCWGYMCCCCCGGDDEVLLLLAVVDVKEEVEGVAIIDLSAVVAADAVVATTSS